jgi:pimeloyl-ACP methyl ester carboxylesterase
MSGDHDLIREEHTIKLYQSLPNSYLAIIPGASHIAPYEKPGIVNPIIIDFLKKPYAEINRYYFLLD